MKQCESEEQLRYYENLAKKLAVKEFLNLKNSTWLTEGETPLTEEEFNNHITLHKVKFDKDGNTIIYCDDGDLFFGHLLCITLNQNMDVINSDLMG